MDILDTQCFQVLWRCMYTRISKKLPSLSFEQAVPTAQSPNTAAILSPAVEKRTADDGAATGVATGGVTGSGAATGGSWCCHGWSSWCCHGSGNGGSEPWVGQGQLYLDGRGNGRSYGRKKIMTDHH
jgi:hypothetical protein